MSKILIVDDNQDIRNILVTLVAEEGHHPVVAAGGREAVARIAVEPFDVILSDRNMPDVDGLDVLIAASRMAPETPVIMLTSDRTHEFIADAKRYGAYACLGKPIGLADLMSVVNLALAGRQRRRRASRELGTPATGMPSPA